MKKKILKMLSLILTFVGLLIVFCSCTPLSVINEDYIMDGCIVISTTYSDIIEDDNYGRCLGRASSYTVEGQDLYIVLQSYYDRDDIANLTYKKGNYYFFDYECKGQDSEEFKQFLEDNLWQSPEKVPKEQLGIGLESKDETMEKFNNAFRWSDNSFALFFKKAVKDFGITDFSKNRSAYDKYSRLMFGINVPSTVEGEQPKVYAAIFQATCSSTLYYLADVFISEIRLDHYFDDLEAFKKANNWGEPLTVSDLNDMEKTESWEISPVEKEENSPVT